MPRKRILRTVERKHPNNPNRTIEKEVERRISGKKPKKPSITQKQITREFLKKAGLHKTKMQRERERKTWKEHFGYDPPRLSMSVGTKRADGTIKPGKASRYTKKGTRPVYKTVKETRPAERVLRTDFWGEPITDIWGNPVYVYKPAKEVVTGKKLAGERFIAKRLSKKGQRGKGSTVGAGPVTRGSIAARKGKKKRQRAAGRKGQRPGKEARKKKKKR